jgi:hypothetical protein
MCDVLDACNANVAETWTRGMNGAVLTEFRRCLADWRRRFRLCNRSEPVTMPRMALRGIAGAQCGQNEKCTTWGGDIRSPSQNPGLDRDVLEPSCSMGYYGLFLKG